MLEQDNSPPLRDRASAAHLHHRGASAAAGLGDREGFPKGEIGRLLALMHEIDHNALSDLLKPLREGRP